MAKTGTVVGKIAVLGITGIALATPIYGITAWVQYSRHSSRVDDVKDLISGTNIQGARDLLKEYKNQKLLEDSDLLTLKLAINQREQKERLEDQIRIAKELISKGDYYTAKEKVADLKGKIGEKKYSGLNEGVEGLSPEKQLDDIHKSSGYEWVMNMETFMKTHPRHGRSAGFKQELPHSCLSLAHTYFENDGSEVRASQLLKRVHDYLEGQTATRPPLLPKLNSGLDDELLTSTLTEGRKYLERKKAERKFRTPEIGDKVKVGKAMGPLRNKTEDNYFFDFNIQNVRPGSVGVITDKDSDDDLVVTIKDKGWWMIPREVELLESAEIAEIANLLDLIHDLQETSQKPSEEMKAEVLQPEAMESEGMKAELAEVTE